MMRLTMSRAAAALLRALLALADAPAGSLRLVAYQATEFAIGASFVADIVGKRGEHSPGNSTELLIEALTIVA
jgi:hypothetical protein